MAEKKPETFIEKYNRLMANSNKMITAAQKLRAEASIQLTLAMEEENVVPVGTPVYNTSKKRKGIVRGRVAEKLEEGVLKIAYYVEQFDKNGEPSPNPVTGRATSGWIVEKTQQSI